MRVCVLSCFRVRPAAFCGLQFSIFLHRIRTRSVALCVFVSLDCAAVGIVIPFGRNCLQKMIGRALQMLILALLLPHPARMTRALDWSQSSDVLLCHADLQQCGASAAAAVAKNSRKILDITHTLREDLPIWLGEDGLGRITAPVLSMSRGDDANVSELKLDSVHTGTHVDAPGHYVQEFYEEGLDVALLDLNILVGKE